MPKFQRIYWSKKFDWKHYSRIYDKYAKSKNNYYQQSASVLLNAVKTGKHSKIIDLACGTGALTAYVLKKFPKTRIFAIDLSKEMLEYYNKNFSNEIKNGQVMAVVGNAEKISTYLKEKYDLAFISSALWDLEIESVFKSLSNVIRKNGHIIFNLPALVVEKERGFIFFIEHFFRQMLNSKIIYRRIKISYLKKLFKRYNLKMVKMQEYSFRMSKQNVGKFFDLLRYRYPFILFPKEMQYQKKLKKCTEIFNESLKYVLKKGIREEGVVFVVQRK